MFCTYMHGLFLYFEARGYGNTGCGVFKRGIEIFLTKNQHTKRKLLNFGLMASC